MKQKLLFSLLFLLLAGVVVFWGVKPLWDHHRGEARAQHLMRNAYQIHQALFAYASSHDRVLPNQTVEGADFASSNEAFRQLFIGGVIDDESLFFAAGTPWCVGSKPDGVIGSARDHFAAAVAPGENFWGYRTGLAANQDDSTAPLLMDGFTAEQMTGKPARSSGNDAEMRLVLRLGGSVRVVAGTDAEAKLKGELGDARILLPQLPPAP